MIQALLLLVGAGFLGGCMNALAGGGSFVTLSSLIASGLTSVQANASSTVALWPGGAASAWTYHETFRPVCGVRLPWLLAVTLVGGLLGGLLLLVTPSAAFDKILPWLLLLAFLVIAFGRRVGLALRGQAHAGRATVLAGQFALGVYGGYFGGAVSIMMVAVWLLLGEPDIKPLNAPRTLLVSAANSVAAVAFILAGAVAWPQTLAVLAGGLLGGVVGARIGRAIPPTVTRIVTLVFTFAITAIFFLRAYA